MFKPRFYKAARYLGCFVNQTREGDLQLRGKPSAEHEWSFGITLQGLTPVQFLAWVRGETEELPQPEGVIASFSRPSEVGYVDVDLDVEFLEDGRCRVSSGKTIVMVFRWSRRIYETTAGDKSTYKEDDKAFTYGILIEGAYPEEALNEVTNVRRRPTIQSRTVKSETTEISF